MPVSGERGGDCYCKPRGGPPKPLCFHEEEKEDHKCFEACNGAGKKFATKGIEGTGKCPSSYNTVDSTKIVLQCPDGVTNLRYCASTALNVTIATKGEAGLVVGASSPGGDANPAQYDHCSALCDKKCDCGGCYFFRACRDSCLKGGKGTEPVCA